MKRAIVPRHVVIDDFLAPEHLAALDSYAASREGDLCRIDIEKEADGSEYSASRPAPRRLWQAAGALGPCEPRFTAAVAGRLGELFAGTGTLPFDVAHYESELNAQFSGSYFGRHIDTVYGEHTNDRTTNRVISIVFYFSRPDASFAGGELLLFPFNDTVPALSIAPLRNRLVAFPSFAVHEVSAVVAEDEGMANVRLSVNCWLHCARPGLG